MLNIDYTILTNLPDNYLLPQVDGPTISDLYFSVHTVLMYAISQYNGQNRS